ncbi:MAG: DUF4010 domain-containing protein [Pseudomonadota bacterium]
MQVATQFEELLSRIALAFGIGLLIGLERGWNTREMQPGSRVAGVRTFGISGLLGGLVAALTGPADTPISVGGALLVGMAFATFSAVFVAFSRNGSRPDGNRSATSAIAALLTFVLGAYAVRGNMSVAAATAVAAAGVLAFREGIHRWVAQITRRELESGLVLLAMSFIGLPLFPDSAIGPFGGVNLREVWIIAIALATLSFGGYVTVRHFGERRGELISAAIGGIVSSTAVAISNARRASSRQGSAPLLAAATSLAMAVSFVRVIAITSALRPSLVLSVGAPLLVASAVAVTFALLRARRSMPEGLSRAPIAFRNPFGFWSVLAMAAFMGVLIVVGRLISEHFGNSATVAGAAAMGLFDVDAMTVSMARLASDALPPRAAALAILSGVASNTFLKVLVAGIVGRGRFAIHVAVICLACTIAGALVLVLEWPHPAWFLYARDQ